METVKVDIRKLQLLNERINQTIEALAQLRQSVHGFQSAGLQHTAEPPTQQLPFGVPQQVGVYGNNLPQQVPYSPVAPAAPPQAQAPWFQQPQAAINHSVLPQATVPQNAALQDVAPYGYREPMMARFQQAFPFAFSNTLPVTAI